MTADGSESMTVTSKDPLALTVERRGGESVSGLSVGGIRLRGEVWSD